MADGDLGTLQFRIQANLDSVVYAEKRLNQLREKFAAPVEVVFDANYASVQEAWDRIMGLQQQINEMDLQIRVRLDQAYVDLAVATLVGLKVRAEENPIIVPVQTQMTGGATPGGGPAIVPGPAGEEEGAEGTGGGMFSGLGAKMSKFMWEIFSKYWIVSFAARSIGQGLSGWAAMRRFKHISTAAGALGEQKGAQEIPILGPLASGIYDSYDVVTGQTTIARQAQRAQAMEKFTGQFLVKYFSTQAGMEETQFRHASEFGANSVAEAAQLRELHFKRLAGQQAALSAAQSAVDAGVDQAMAQGQYNQEFAALNASITAQEQMIREKTAMQAQALAENISAVHAATRAYHYGTTGGLKLREAQMRLAAAEDQERRYIADTADKTGGKFSLGTARAQMRLEQMLYQTRMQLESMHYAARMAQAGDNPNSLAARRAQLGVWYSEQAAQLRQKFAGADLARAMHYLREERGARADAIHRDQERARQAAEASLDSLAHRAIVANIAATDPEKAKRVAARLHLEEEIAAVARNRVLSSRQKKEADDYYRQIYHDQKHDQKMADAHRYALQRDPLAMLGRTLETGQKKHEDTGRQTVAELRAIRRAAQIMADRAGLGIEVGL